MVLRSKEREEAIQLITMDPKVYGKLLMLHRRGYGVDLEALRNQLPLRRIARKGLKMGSHGYRRLRLWKQGFVVLSDVFGVYEYIQAKEVGRWSHEGPTRVGRAYPPGPALLPRGRLVASLTSTPSVLDCVCSKNDSLEGFIPFGLRLIFLFCGTLKQAKKQQFVPCLRLIGQFQNTIEVYNKAH